MQNQTNQNNSLTLTAFLFEVFPSTSYNNNFTKREFIVKLDGKYPQFIKFELHNERCDLIDSFQTDEEMHILFDLRGKPYTNADNKTIYFTNLVAWSIQKVNHAPNVPLPPSETINTTPPDNNDDLPF